MVTTASGRYIFQHAALQNHAVAASLSKIADRSISIRQDISTIEDHFSSIRQDTSLSERIRESVASSPLTVGRRRSMRQMDGFGSISMKSSRLRLATPIVGALILLAGIVAIGFVIGPTLYDIFVTNWKTILLSLGGICVGAGIILLFGRIGTQPLKKVYPPDGTSEEPLTELERLASRTVSRLRTAYRIQISLICIVAAILLFVILWSIVMVTQNRLKYATAFGSSGIGMLALSKWKWQPFERVAEARKLADDADILTTGLRLRIKSISEITDPKERSQAQWVAVSEYLDRS